MTTSIKDTALDLCKAKFPVLPLFGPTEGDANQRGKRPRQARWQDSFNTEAQLSFWFDQFPNSNVGLITGAASGLVCIDVDPRNGGDAWYDFNKHLLTGGITETTGSGGLHIWYRHPGGFVESHTGKDGIAKGVELKADGGHQVVITPSVHKCGQPYTCPTDFISIRAFEAEPLPEWLAKPIAMPEKRKRRKEVYGDKPVDIEACKDRLDHLAPAIQDHGGDQATFVACCLGRDHDLSPETFLPLLQGWNERCRPRWPQSDLMDKLEHGYRYAKAVSPGSAAPSKQFAVINAESQREPIATLSAEQAETQTAELVSWTSYLLPGYKDLPHNCEANILLILSNDDEINRSLRWNEFTSTLELTTADPPWHRKGEHGLEYTDADSLGIHSWLTRKYHVPFDLGKITTAAIAAGKINCYHPVRDYLDSLAWDGAPRIDSLFPVYFGAEDSPYTRAVGRCTLLAAVARVRTPGCLVHTVTTTIGPQGCGKSSAWRVLASPRFYTDADIDAGSKDAALVLRGRWIAELSEVHTLHRSTANQQKGWISRSSDRQRDPYARLATDTPRMSILVGTSNEARYLSDPSGGRRHWPITVGKIDLFALTRDRDQLWAEASRRRAEGEQWWFTPEIEALAAVEQAERLETDERSSLVATWLELGQAPFEGGDRAPYEAVTGEEVWIGCGFGTVDTWTRRAQLTISSIMQSLGWRRGNPELRGKRRKAYINPAFDPEASVPTVRIGTPIAM